MVLTIAIPPAAALPTRNDDGMDQNGPLAAPIPMGTSTRRTIAAGEGPSKAHAAKPQATTPNGMATWSGRSPVRSECALFSIMITITTALMAPEIMPTVRLLPPTNDLMICGDQIVYAYMPRLGRR